MKVHATVARNIRKLRVERGISQENLAVDAEIDRTYVSRLERGLENPTIGVLERIANALDTQLINFFVPPSTGARVPQNLRGGRKKKN